MTWQSWHVGCCALRRADCADTKQRIGGTGTVAVCASAWIVLQPWCRNRRSPTLPRMQARGLCVNANDVAELARRLPCAQVSGLCLNADDVAELARRLLRAHTRGLCCPHGAPVPPALRLPCVQARIVLATGNQLRAAYCVTVRASECRARSSAWMVEAGVCPATPTSPGPSVRRAQAHTRRRAGNGPRRVRAPTP